MFSLYSYWYQPINSVVRLDNYDMVTKDMPNYDSAVIIYNPLKFIEKIEAITSIHCNHIQYTDETPNDFEIENKLPESVSEIDIENLKKINEWYPKLNQSEKQAVFEMIRIMATD